MRTKERALRVTDKAPCPVCQKPDWCGVSADGRFALCMRVASEKKMKNGGWLHALDGAVNVKRYVEPRPVIRDIDFQAMTSACYFALPEGKLAILADKLGLSLDAMYCVGAGWHEQQTAYSFPMWEWSENQPRIIGIRLRADDGSKFCVKGSRNGLFIPMMMPRGYVLVVEGPTDVAAAQMLGVYAIGRPSNTGGEEQVVVWLHRNPTLSRIKHVAIVADRDQGGTGERTLSAAGSLAQRLLARFTVKVLRLPRHKDLREWVRNGCAREALDCVIRNASAVQQAV